MIGQLVSHYKLLEVIGEGGMGIVYRAKDMKLDRIVALKFLTQHIAHDTEEKLRFIQEARLASMLDHPNICTIHEIDETTDGRVFIVMAYYAAAPLAEKTKLAPLTLPEALDIAIQIADGLQAAHRVGVVHCDIKSSNILVSRADVTSPYRVKIIDFGLSKNHRLSMATQNASTGGTIPYMSPEQARGEAVDEKTDIWSLGVVLYEMLTGRLPFEGEYKEVILYKILHDDPPPMMEVPSGIERIVKRCLQKEPAHRYVRMAQMLSELRREKSCCPAVEEVDVEDYHAAPFLGIDQHEVLVDSLC